MDSAMTPIRDLCRCLATHARGAIAGVLLAASLPAAAAKVTPLGFELIPAHYPESTYEDILQSLRITAAFGSHSSFIWHWSEESALPLILPTLPVMRQFGLKSLVQVGAIFLREPAPPGSLAKSFGDPATRARYLADVERIAAAQPDYLVLATEINLLARFNAPEFEHFRSLYVEAYNAVKRISPGTSVGVSFLYTVWFAEYWLDGKDVPSMLTPFDFIAFTAYPIDLVTDGFYPDIASIPDDWFGAARLAYPQARILFSEIGWPSKWLGTQASQAEFVRNVPRLLSKVGPERATWAVLHDMEFFGRHILDPAAVAFLESLGVDIDALFAHFNGMGLLDGLANPKPALLDASQLEFAP